MLQTANKENVSYMQFTASAGSKAAPPSKLKRAALGPATSSNSALFLLAKPMENVQSYKRSPRSMAKLTASVAKPPAAIARPAVPQTPTTKRLNILADDDAAKKRKLSILEPSVSSTSASASSGLLVEAPSMAANETFSKEHVRQFACCVCSLLTWLRRKLPCSRG
jgi:hypothetical protein